MCVSIFESDIFKFTFLDSCQKLAENFDETGRVFIKHYSNYCDQTDICFCYILLYF